MSIVGEKHVVGFDVSVNYAKTMGIGQRTTALNADLENLARRQRGVFLDYALEIRLRQILHHDIVYAVVAAGVVDLDNVWMV